MTIWRKKKKKQKKTCNHEPQARKAGSKVVRSDCENSERWEEPEKERRKRGRQPRRWREEKLNECFSFFLFLLSALLWVFLISPNKFVSAADGGEAADWPKKKKTLVSRQLWLLIGECAQGNRSRSLGGRVGIQFLFLRGAAFSVRATSAHNRGDRVTAARKPSSPVEQSSYSLRRPEWWQKWHQVELMRP